jgi:NTE family protein
MKRFLKSSCYLLAIFLLSSCTTIPPQVNTPAHEPPATALKNLHPDVVLVLGSGGARGFSHVGVLKVLQENHIPIDMIVGVSAGSIVGALYADNVSAARVRELLLEAKRDKVIDISVFNIPTGAISGKGLQDFLNANMRAKNFNQLQIPFVAVATELETGDLHVFASGPIAPAVNASAAAPPFFRPVKMYGKLFADGGLVDPVAVDVAKRFHPKVIIAVRLDTGLSESMPTTSAGYFLRGFDLMLRRLNYYTARDADVVIAPQTGDINMFQESGRSQLMQVGEQAAWKAMPEIKRILKEKGIPY